MADDLTPPVADPPVAPPADPPVASPADGDEPFDRERAMATIHKLREAEKEGKRTARELEEARARLQEIEDAQKSELELAQQRAADLEAKQAAWETERRETNLKLAVYGRQAELGIADSDLALAALDRGQVEFDDRGQPTNVDALLTDLLERKPLLKGQPAPPAAPDINGGSGARGGPAPALTAEELAAAKQHGMSPERYALAKTAGSLQDLIEARKAGAS